MCHFFLFLWDKMEHSKKLLFRQEALDYHNQTAQGFGVTTLSPPWTWILILVICAMLTTAFAFSLFGYIELNSRGRGILRPAGGVRNLVSQVNGTVKKIHIHSGEKVKTGELLIDLDAPEVQRELLSAQRQTRRIQSDYVKLTEEQKSAFDRQIQNVKNRITIYNEQLLIQKQSLTLFEKNFHSKVKLEKDSILSSTEVDAAAEQVAQAKRQLLSIQQALDMALQEKTTLEKRRHDEIWEANNLIDEVTTRLDALKFTLEQTEIRAPEDGTVEAILVKPAEAIRYGQVVGKVIPEQSSLNVISFLAERDRAFVKAGDEVCFELDQLPYTEFGVLLGKISRISNDLASPYEIQEAFGENFRSDIPCFRIELEITGNKLINASDTILRSGMLMNVRYTLRKQRLLTLLLDPLKRWLK